MTVVITKNTFFIDEYVVGGQIITEGNRKVLEIFLSTGEKVQIPLPNKTDDEIVLKVITQFIYPDQQIIDIEELIEAASTNLENIKNEMIKQKIIDAIADAPLEEILDKKVKELIEG